MLRIWQTDFGYALKCAATLSIAVGASATLFVPVSRIWLQRTSAPDADRVAVVTRMDVPEDGSRFTDPGIARLQSLGFCQALAGQVVAGNDFAGLRPRLRVDAAGEVPVSAVTPGYFALFGIRVTGREFADTDVTPGAPLTALISERMWRKAYGASPTLVGSTVAATPEPVTIIGIVPGGFNGPVLGEGTELWIPHRLVWRVNRLPDPDLLLPMTTFCRLHDGDTLTRAQERLWQAGRLSDRDLAVVPVSMMFGSDSSALVRVRPDQILGAIGIAAMVVVGSGATTLICLTLGRGERRRSEFAIRTALGASRGRLLSDAIKEHAGIALAGTAGAVLAAQAAVALLPRVRVAGGVDLARLGLHVDWPVLAAAFGASCGCLLLAAVGSAAGATRRSSGLMASAATATGGSVVLRKVIAAAQAGVSVVFVAIALIVGRSFMGIADRAPGLDVDRTAFVTVQTRHMTGLDLPDRPATSARDRALVLELIEAVRQLPAVEVVALGPPPIGREPARSLARARSIRVDGQQETLTFGWLSVGEEYLDALGVTTLTGRSGRRAEAVITAAMANAVSAGVSPVGRHLTLPGFSGPVTGVVDLAFGSLRWEPQPAVLTFDGDAQLVRALASSGTFSLALRTQHPENLRPMLDEASRRIFPDAAVRRIATGRDMVNADLDRERLSSWFFAAYGAVAFVLAVAGVGSLASYLAQRQGRKAAIMNALGASHTHIAAGIARAVMIPVLSGSLAGLVLATWAVEVLSAYLVMGAESAGLAYGEAFAVVALSAAIATAPGAVRLMRTDPLAALRAE